jgi:hypothetical protein
MVVGRIEILSFVICDDKKIQIRCDAQGISILLQMSAELVGERASHRHLRTPSRGGKELSETDSSGVPAVHDVIIDYAEGD